MVRSVLIGVVLTDFPGLILGGNIHFHCIYILEVVFYGFLGRYGLLWVANKNCALVGFIVLPHRCKEE